MLKFTDYVKIEQIKSILMERLSKLGLKEQLKVMTDEDMSKLITMMWYLGNLLEAKKSEEEKNELLMNYVVGLWARLIVDYSAGIEEL